jgi:hypothetical protein
MLLPDSYYRCVKMAREKNHEGKLFILKEGSEYSKTEVKLSDFGHSSDEVQVILFNQSRTRPELVAKLTKEDFARIEKEHLEKIK